MSGGDGRRKTSVRAVSPGGAAGVEVVSRARLRELWRVSYPIVASGLITVLTTAADSVMLGRYATQALASVALSAPVYVVATVFVICWTIGVQVLGARRFGAGRPRTVGQVSEVSLAVAVCVGAAISLALFPGAPALLGVLSEREGIVAWATTYLRLVGLSLPFFAVMVVLRATCAGLGDTRAGMWTALLVVALNVPASLALIFALELGVAGAALGTLLATAAGSLFMVARCLRCHRGPYGLFYRENLLSWRAIIPEVWRVGWPEASMAGLAYASAVVVVGFVTGLGEVPLAAARLVDAVLMVLWTVVFSCSIGVSILAGRGLRAGNLAGVAAYRRAGLAIMLLLALPPVLAVLIFPETLFGLFTDDGRVVAEAADAAYLLPAITVLMALGMAPAGVLRAAGDTRGILLASTIADYLVRLPLAWLLIWPAGLGLAGYWAVRAAVTIARNGRGRWKAAVE